MNLQLESVSISGICDKFEADGTVQDIQKQ
jgi:hypothetical protein